jgi:hypothetical protein
MTLQDLGSIGEIVGALAVLVSLAYLALQIRQNTQALRASIQQENRKSIAEFYRLLVNPDTARIWRVGLSEPAKLGEADAVSFHALLSFLFNHFEAAFHRRALPQVHDAHSDEPREVAIRGLLRAPGFLPWWQSYRRTFSSDFQEHVEQLWKVAD